MTLTIAAEVPFLAKRFDLQARRATIRCQDLGQAVLVSVRARNRACSLFSDVRPSACAPAPDFTSSRFCRESLSHFLINKLGLRGIVWVIFDQPKHITLKLWRYSDILRKSGFIFRLGYHHESQDDPSAVCIPQAKLQGIFGDRYACDPPQEAKKTAIVVVTAAGTRIRDLSVAGWRTNAGGQLPEV